MLVCLLNSPYFHSKSFDPVFFQFEPMQKVKEFSGFT